MSVCMHACMHVFVCPCVFTDLIACVAPFAVHLRLSRAVPGHKPVSETVIEDLFGDALGGEKFSSGPEGAAAGTALGPGAGGDGLSNQSVWRPTIVPSTTRSPGFSRNWLARV